MIARRFVLLERAFVLFVQHDQPQMRRRRKDRAARADDDLHFAARNPLPMPVPLGIAQMLCSTATLSNRDSNRARVCGVRLISGTSTIACRP